MKTPGLAGKEDVNYDRASDTSEETDDDEDSEDTFLEPSKRSLGYRESDDPGIVKMNQYHDEWDSWIPETPIEAVMKRAVDKAL